MTTSLSWHLATVVLSPFLMPGSKFARLGFRKALVNCAWIKKAFASARVRRGRASRSRFLKDVVSLLRRWGVSRNGKRSGAAPGPSVPGHVRFARSRRTSLWGLLEGRVALTSQRGHCHFWTPRNGSWRRSPDSSARETSEFLKHVPSCMLFDVQKVVIRRDASERSAKDAQHVLHSFQSCVESFASGFTAGLV